MEEPYDWYVINTDVEVSNGTTTPNPFVIDLEVVIQKDIMALFRMKMDHNLEASSS